MSECRPVGNKGLDTVGTRLWQGATHLGANAGSDMTVERGNGQIIILKTKIAVKFNEFQP